MSRYYLSWDRAELHIAMRKAFEVEAGREANRSIERFVSALIVLSYRGEMSRIDWGTVQWGLNEPG